MLEGESIIGLTAVEPNMKKGTTPLKALKVMRHGFDFLGIAGKKFIPKIFNENNKIGHLITESTQNTIRFLLLDPECEQIDIWIADRNRAENVRADIKTTLKLLSQQIKIGRKIQVRLYNFFPPMRLHIIDNSVAYISDYSPVDDFWYSPQLIFDSNAKRSFVRCLNNLFDFLWKNASELDIERFLNYKENK